MAGMLSINSKSCSKSRKEPLQLTHSIDRFLPIAVVFQMAERECLDLSPDQSKQLDKVLTVYFKDLIKAEAAAFSGIVQLKYDLRESEVDMTSVQSQLKEISDFENSIQLSAIKGYLAILDILSPEQRQKLDERIGSAFPSMWQQMRKRRPWMKAEEEHESEADEPEGDKD